MTFNERTSYQAFIENKEYIENKWSRTWGDRMNELVFIGQDIEKEKIIADLERCLLQTNEQHLFDTNGPFNDPFPKEL
jgi:G3E family GTPase